MQTPAFFLTCCLTATTAFAQTAPRVGVGTTTPRAGLELNHNDGLLATGTFGAGNTDELPVLAGARLMWIPRKAAFRAGFSSDEAWSGGYVGEYSVATGNQTRASGANSTAMGMLCNARGAQSTAIGYRAMAIGDFSTAIGADIQANHRGSLVLGDASGVRTDSHREHQFLSRFAGGYTLLTHGSLDIGPAVRPGDSTWGVLSDSTKKEGFRPADGAAFLRKIASMRLGSWNYKGQDARTFRHYGPMAQDFYAAFGHDGVGTISTDTTINQADFDGINLIAIQALTYKTERLEAEKRQADERLARLEAENQDLRRLLGQLTADVQRLKATASR